jgi:DNA-binding GntR family transcriptional regulator
MMTPLGGVENMESGETSVVSSRVTERVCEELREMIMDGRLVGGTRLKETALSRKVGTSRTPIREALVQLESEGLVVRMPHAGAIVRTLDERDVEDAFQLRALLEGYGAAYAAQRLTEEQIRELENLCDEMEGPLERGGDQRAVAYVLERNDRFHRIILEASGNRRLTVALRATMEIPRVYKSYYWYSEQERQRSFLYHRELIEAFRNRDPLWAEATMKSHVYAARDYLLTKLRKEGGRRLHSA